MGLARSLWRSAVLFGATAAAYWVARRRYHGPTPSLLNWEQVGSTARRFGALDADDQNPSIAVSDIAREYESLVRQSRTAIAAYVGEPLGGETPVFVFNRRDWIDANIAGFRQLFEPIETFYKSALFDRTIGGAIMGRGGQIVVSAELGGLLAVLARRVLGQYDLALLGREPLSGGRLYFVEPNIERLRSRLDLDRREFRLWIALHESTHAFEFEGHPWLRDHMNSLILGYFDSVTSDLKSLRHNGGLPELLRRALSGLRRARHPVEMVMSTEQRLAFRQLQALMCVLEGYSNHVMDAVGLSLLPTYPRMKSMFDDRRKKRSLADELVARVTGLDMKYEQYELGERFINQIVRSRGLAFANRVWLSPWHLPTIDEVREPTRWLERVGG